VNLQKPNILFLTIGCLVSELCRSHGASVEKRCLALTNACQLFDHSMEHLHNLELTHGALTEFVKILFLHQQQPPHLHHKNMLHLILSATEMLFRGSPSALASVFYNIQHPNHSNDSGGILFLQTLLRLLDQFEMPSKGIQTKQSSAHDASSDDPEMFLNRKIVHNVGLILISYTRSSELRSLLYQNSELLTEWTKFSSVTRDGKDSMIRKTNPDCRLCRLQIVVRLIQNSNNVHRELLYHSYGLSEMVLRFAHFDPVDSVRQAAASCIVEFTSAPKNCQSMARDAKYLGTLVKMILVEEASSVSNSATVSIRESALTALQNIAFDRLNRPYMIRFKNGLLLEVLKKTLASDVDPKIRRRAAGTVVNLVGDETADFMVTYKGLLDTLALVTTQDDNHDVQVRSVLALTKLASYVADLYKPPEPSKSYSAVLDALVVASLNKIHCPRVTAVVRSIARNHPDQRPILAQHDGIVDTLTDILHTEPLRSAKLDDVTHSTGKSRQSTLNASERVNAIHALAHLANSNDTTRVFLCSRPAVLTAVVVAAQQKDLQDVALRVLKRLATVAANRSILANCPGLIVAVAEAVEREALWDRRHALLTEHRSEDDQDSTTKIDGLAKALLLSLLLTM
jgi:hypothetical protein